MDLAFENLSRIGEVLFFESDREAKFFRQIWMRLFLIELIGVVVEQTRVVRVLHHAEGKRLENRLIM